MERTQRSVTPEARLDAELALAAGRWQEAHDRYAELIASAEEPMQRADLQVGLAEALCRLDRGSEAVAIAADAAARFAAADRPVQRAYATFWQAYGLYQQERLVDARVLLADLLRQVREGLDVAPDFRFRLLSALGNVASWEGEHQRALAYLEEARAAASDLDLPRRAALLASLALAHREAGDLEGAIRAGSESLEIYRSISADAECVAVENNLALTYLELGSIERASKAASDGLGAARRIEDAVAVAVLSDTLARVAIAEGNAEQARALLEDARQATSAVDLPSVQADINVTTARLALLSSDLTRAIASLEEAAAVLRASGPTAKLRRVLVDMATLLTDAGDHQSAIQVYREAFGPHRRH